MKVHDIASFDPITIEVTASLDEAQRLMNEHDIRHLPVMKGATLVGVLSERDVLASTGWIPDGKRAARPVEDVMRSPVVTVEPEDSTVTAALELVLRRVGCLPVLRADRLVAILTELDLLRAFVIARENGDLGDEEDPPLADLMTREVLTASPDRSIDEAVAILRAHDIHHLPIVDGDTYVSIVSDRDLRAAAGSGLAGTTPLSRILPRPTLRALESEPASAAARAMLDHKIGSLPILRDHALRGILSVKDLMEHCMKTLWHSADGSRR